MDKLIVRIDTISSQHVRFTIFMNGANCGELCLLKSEAFVFINALNLGADAADLLMEIKNDKGIFSDNCGTPNKCISLENTEMHRRGN